MSEEKLKETTTLDYKGTSQANYELISGTQKGSFCCLLRNNTNKEYYVLTAYHCLDTNAIEEGHKALLTNSTETINLIIDDESVEKNTSFSKKNLDASIIKVDEENENLVNSIFYKNLISPQIPCECNNKGNGNFVAYNQVCEKIKSEVPKKWEFKETQGKLDGSSGGLLMNISERIIGVYNGGTKVIDYGAFCEITNILGENYYIV